MSKVVFVFDLKKDARNIWQTVNKKPKFGASWQKSISLSLSVKIKKPWPKAKSFIYTFLKKYYKENREKLELALKQFEQAWRLIEKEYFKRLEKITKKPICSKKFTAYLTLSKRCPYHPKENSFGISFFNSQLVVCKVIAHEIMHLQFHKYFWENCEKQIGKVKTADLKEALTILLNLEFNDLLIVKDIGYPKHQKLRRKLAESWKDTQDFNKLISNGINFLK